MWMTKNILYISFITFSPPTHPLLIYNLPAARKMIISQEQEGLSWGQTFKLEPVAYGIMKLVMTCTIVDSLVLMDDITDKIEGLEDFVQSVQVASMNKL